jgi:hypothetical protein
MEKKSHLRRWFCVLREIPGRKFFGGFRIIDFSFTYFVRRFFLNVYEGEKTTRRGLEFRNIAMEVIIDKLPVRRAPVVTS